ncbi:MAG TPA: hypothetical protein VK433_08680 [Stellaceae bacterium]|nr:hypothetical protein [Stellaceae bacterium]
MGIEASTLARVSVVLALAMAAPLPALAQAAPQDTVNGTPATREGNIYDGQKHRINGPAPSAQTNSEVDAEVQELLKQTEQQDKQSQRQQKNAPVGPPPPR